MKRRNLIKTLVGTAISSTLLSAAKTYEKLYFNYLDVIGNQVFESDQNLYNYPIFVYYESGGILLRRSTNIEIFASKNDANRFISDLISKQYSDDPQNYLYDECDDLHAATLVINANRMAISNRRGPANTIIVSPNIYRNVESSMLNNSCGAGTYMNFNNKIHVNDDRMNTIEMFYKGTEKWDAPLAYKVLPSGEVEVRFSPGFERSVRNVKII